MKINQLIKFWTGCTALTRLSLKKQNSYPREFSRLKYSHNIYRNKHINHSLTHTSLSISPNPRVNCNYNF